ncbi:MAG: metallophosphoesterase [Muribaculaceae bacterium]|nr:metallophosphoesterase [Muribaculaceae bacterium]
MRIPLIMALVVGLFAILIDAFIYYDIKRLWPKKKWPDVVYGISSVLCWALILVVVLLPYRSSGQNIVGIMWCLFTFITIYAAKCVYAIWALFGMVPKIWKLSDWRLCRWVGLLSGILVLCTLWWGAMVTRHKIEVVKVTFTSGRLPEAFEGFRIAQISDLHVGTWGEDTRFISRLVDSVNAYHPDIILFTGDIVNRETSELAPFLSTLSRLKAPYGVYSVLGNHDYGDYVDWKHSSEREINNSLLAAWERQIGWKVLDNNVPQILFAVKC